MIHYTSHVIYNWKNLFHTSFHTFGACAWILYKPKSFNNCLLQSSFQKMLSMVRTVLYLVEYISPLVLRSHDDCVKNQTPSVKCTMVKTKNKSHDKEINVPGFSWHLPLIIHLYLMKLFRNARLCSIQLADVLRHHVEKKICSLAQKAFNQGLIHNSLAVF